MMGDPEGRVAPHADAVAVGWVFRPIRRLFLPSCAAAFDEAGRGQGPPPRCRAHRSVPMARGPGEPRDTAVDRRSERIRGKYRRRVRTESAPPVAGRTDGTSARSRVPEKERGLRVLHPETR